VVTPPAATAEATPLATSVPVTPTTGTSRIVVQQQDNSLKSVDSSGNATLLYNASAPVDLSAIFPPGNVVDDFIYLPLSGQTATVVRASPRGTDTLPGINGAVYGIAVTASKLAWGTADLQATPPNASIFISGPDGANAQPVVNETYTTAIGKVLRVMRWSKDGNRLYFGKEPVGLGGYILFSGLTNLWVYDATTNQTTELVPERAANAAICIDDLSPDEKLIADHCSPQAMEIVDIATQKTTAVTAPADVTQFGSVGGARFSPDSTQLAYGLARNDPNNEQGWVAVADVASGSSRLIATSPASGYFSVVAWLDAKTLVLQSSGQQQPGVWTVQTDGSNLNRLTDGTFLGILTGSTTGGQAQGQSCGEISLLGPNPPTDPAVGTAATCFFQAFQSGQPASLKVTVAGVDAGIVHQLTLTKQGNGLVIQDNAAHYVAPRPPSDGQVSVCQGVTLQADGLLIKGCGDQGDILIPLPK
jgi:hypothetical protein